MDSVLVARLNPERIMNAWFTDPWFAAQHLGRYKVRQFIYDIFYAGQICQCLKLDYDVPDIYRHFTEEELYTLWYVDDIANYNYFANTVENLNRYDETGQAVLVDIVEKADAAMAGNDVAANLRFGHDSGLMSLWAFLRVAGNETSGHMAEGPDLGWYCFREMTMGSNLQLIFYKNAADDVIVKILRDEKEIVLPSLKPWKGPYYKWKERSNKLEVTLERAHKGDLNVGYVDWNPRPVDESMGLWRDVTLSVTGDVRMSDGFVRPQVKEDLSAADLTVSAVLTNLTDRETEALFKGSFENGTFAVPVRLAAKETREIVVTPADAPVLHIDNPRLWWCSGLGSPELYHMNLYVECQDGDNSDTGPVDFNGIDAVRLYNSDNRTKVGFRWSDSSL